jgi:hypothetical protein
MRHRRNLWITIALSVVALAAMLAPATQAASVCNEARPGHYGPNNALESDPSTPARYKTGLAALGSNDGLNRAAAHSPALSVCAPPSNGSGDVPPSNGGGGSGLSGLT